MSDFQAPSSTCDIFIVSDFQHISVSLERTKAVTLDQLMKVVKNAYMPRPVVEIVGMLFGYKDWLIPHLNSVKYRSRPHAFKFELTENGDVGMWYKHWASEKTWQGQEENGKVAPLIVLRSIPPGSPSALKPSFSDQYNMEKIASEYEGAKGRMLDDEAKWWEDFIKSETEKRAL